MAKYLKYVKPYAERNGSNNGRRWRHQTKIDLDGVEWFVAFTQQR